MAISIKFINLSKIIIKFINLRKCKAKPNQQTQKAKNFDFKSKQLANTLVFVVFVEMHNVHNIFPATLKLNTKNKMSKN